MHKTKNILLPPPNVTGELHIGHALTYSLSDYFCKLFKITKYESTLLIGFDHGGISTYISACKYYEKSIVNYDEVKTFAEECKEKIRNQFLKFNLSIDWSKEEYTLNDKHTQRVQEAFIELYNQGLIYLDTRIVSYDTKIGTAISDIEIEHREEKGVLYTLEYNCENIKIQVATTRPETCIADVALCVNPKDLRYKHLVGKYAEIPLTKKKIIIIEDEYVDMNFGTGILKITPAHDVNDYNLGEKHNLPKISCINKEGRIILTEIENSENIKFLDNLTIEEARNALNFLYINSEEIKSSVPYHAKNGQKIEYLLETHWFLDMKLAANKALENAPEFHPFIWRNLYKSWLSEIQPWCISRTIPWGQKLPVWTKDSEIKIALKNEDSEYQRTNLVFDTWFSSSLWTEAYDLNIELVVTGYDILFFWISRMVMMTLLLKNKLPFNIVYLHRLVRDTNNKKMSKTLGNVINPLNIIEKFNYDTLRLSLLNKIKIDGNICFGEEDIILSRNILTKLSNLKKFLEFERVPSDNSDQKDIANYFEYRSQMFINEYINNPYNIKISEIINYLYEICDWLVEFSKVNFNLLIFLKEIYKKLLHILYPIIPNTCLEYGYQITYYSEKEIINLDCNLIEIIKFSRSIGCSIKSSIYDKFFQHFHIPVCSESNFTYKNFELFIDNLKKVELLRKKYLEEKESLMNLMNKFNEKTPDLIIETKNSELENINNYLNDLNNLIGL